MKSKQEAARRGRNSDAQPILVTGMPRSGTTWVGQVLSAPSTVGYLVEPFNNRVYPLGQFRWRMPMQFPYFCQQNEDQYAAAIQDMLDFRYQPLAALRAVRSLHALKATARSARSLQRHRQQRRRPLVKDPGAIFSAEWLTRRFAMQVVILVRHPAAVAASFKRLGWRFPFNDLLQQPLLMRELLSPYGDEIERAATRPEEFSTVELAALLWKVINFVVLQYRKQQPHWHILRHEDASREPEKVFAHLCNALDLEYEPAVKNAIARKALKSGNAQATSPFSTRRYAAEAMTRWQKELTPGEIDRIRVVTEPLASAFYDEEDWVRHPQRVA